MTVTRWRALDPPVVQLGEDLELHTFVVDGWQDTPTNLAPEEHDDLAWRQPDEISDLHLAHPGLVPLVTGTGSWEQLEEFAEHLTPAKVTKAGSSPSASTSPAS